MRPRARRPSKGKRGRKRAFYRGGAISDHAAHHQVELALREGTLVRPDRCEKCRSRARAFKNGKSGIQAHHDDYNFPLRVRWLCKACHFLWHRHHVAVPRVGEVEPRRRRARQEREPELEQGPDPGADVAARVRTAGADDLAFLAAMLDG